MDTDAQAPDPTAESSGATPPAPGEFTPITSREQFQAALDPIVKTRVKREQDKYADYKEVKAKAARLDEIEEANKSEVQKLADKLAATERERDEANAVAMRFAVASEHGITRDDAELFLTGTDEATLKRQAQRLIDRDADRKKGGNVVPREGATPNVADNDERAAARALFGGTP